MTVRVQDDLYGAVNGDWEQTATIAPDKAATGGFAALRDGVEDLMKQDLAAMRDGTKDIPFPELETAIAFYRQAGDFATRDLAGVKPLQRRLAAWQGVDTLATFAQQAPSLAQAQFELPFSFSVSPDMKDTAHYAVRLAGPSTILPDTTYYGTPRGEKLLQVWQEMVGALLQAIGEDAATAGTDIAAALAFDARVAATVKSRVQWADRVKSYNPQTMAEVEAQTGDFPFAAFAAALLPQEPTTVIVADPGFLREFSATFNAANFADYRAWARLQAVVAAAPFLSDELRKIGDRYEEARSGSPAPASQETQAYQLTNQFFAEPIGIYYGRTYFGEQAKADVTKLVEQMIATYKRRIKNSPWLSASTKDKAVVKLSTMGLRMGYPDAPHPLYATFEVDSAADLLTNAVNLAKTKAAHDLSLYGGPVDRSVWAMPGHLVNACYRSSWNDITFPAAILQAPFYSLKQTASQNLGGIGAVIAHEISHGFDNNGAQFDEHGNLNNWWTAADYTHFKALTQAMIDQFDGLETEAGKVNGRLVVSENIADAGGLAAAVDTAQRLPDADMQAFFLNWGRIWRQKTRLARQQLLLATDVHAPHPLRANIQPRNIDAWYDTFNVQPTDGMYLPPDKRIHIW